MSEWKTKRFWEQATAEVAPDGYTVKLDGRAVKTPAKELLVVPTQEFAQAIATEWEAQYKEIDPLTMPFTRSANAAIDKVAHQKAEVADMLAAYGDSDLLCYRAEHPSTLVLRQSEQWDPLLDWAAEALSARLETRQGVMHESQRPEALKTLTDRVHRMSVFELAGFHDLVSLSGSLILGFAAALNVHSAKAIWEISRLDELWQAEEWGADEEAEAAAKVKEAAFIHAKQVFDISRA